MCLVWEDRTDEIFWWADYSDERSDYEFTDIVSYSGGPIYGKVVLNINNARISDVIKTDVGNFAGSARMVSSNLRRYLETIANDQLGFFPAVCHCDDGELIGYSLMAPKRHISCVNLIDTDVIDWIIPGKLISRYRNISVNINSIEPFGICRDVHVPRFTIVGRELADTLTCSGFTGLRFVEIAEAHNPFD